MQKNTQKKNNAVVEKDLNHFLMLMDQKGLNTTKQRINIAKVFFCMADHHSLEEIYSEVHKKYPSIGQTTVYRTIKLLCEVELARELHVGEGFARYEVNTAKQHHDHLVCKECGKTVEFPMPEVEQIQRDIAKQHGFELFDHQHILLGICADCLQKKNK